MKTAHSHTAFLFAYPLRSTILTLCFLLLPLLSFAGVTTVLGDSSTIQAAINAAADSGVSPEQAGTDYDLYPVPLANDTAVRLGFKIIHLNRSDAAEVSLILDRAQIESLPLLLSP